MLCRADADERESLVLDLVAQVEQTTPDTAIDRGTWGFGVEAMFRNRSVVLRSSQGPEGTSVFEFPGLTAIPFEHGREGRYRLKLSIERRGAEAVLRGKIWQGDLEPDGWMIENVFELEGPLTQVGSPDGALRVHLLHVQGEIDQGSRREAPLRGNTEEESMADAPQADAPAKPGPRATEIPKPPPEDVKRAESLVASYKKIKSELSKLIVGQDEVIEQLADRGARRRPLPPRRRAGPREDR